MRSLPIALLASLFILGVETDAHAKAAASLDHARLAREKLGADVWSAVIRIENDNPRSAYPRVVHALVFELADILWFYTDADGTQSLSHRLGRTREDRNDLGPLLRAIDAGFGRWSVIDASAPIPARLKRRPLPNGCFIESVALWRELAQMHPGTEARLLSYYGDPQVRVSGHTVLTYVRGDRVLVVDPQRPNVVREFDRHSAADPLSLARAFAGRDLARARYLAFRLPQRDDAPLYTAVPSATVAGIPA